MNRASIRIHDPGNGRVYVRWFSSDRWAWGELLESFKQWFPAHHDRRFDGATKCWSVPAAHLGRVARWIDTHFASEDVEWSEELPSSGGRTYGRRDDRSHGAYPIRPADAVERAYAALHLLPTAPRWATEAVYRAACRAHHPDVGGDGRLMTQVNLAMETIRADQERKTA